MSQAEQAITLELKDKEKALAEVTSELLSKQRLLSQINTNWPDLDERLQEEIFARDRQI
jgi:hypothetical protein